MDNLAGVKVKAPWWQTVIFGRNPSFTLVRILVLIITCFVVFKFVLLPIRVEGGSMLPTYQDHRVNFINQLAYRRSEPKRGDVVAIRMAGKSVMLLKRVIALPGESVGFHLGQAVINGQVLAEPYVKFSCDWELVPVTLGPDEDFVVGDNRSMNMEDHTFGVCQRNRIVGKILL